MCVCVCINKLLEETGVTLMFNVLPPFTVDKREDGTEVVDLDKNRVISTSNLLTTFVCLTVIICSKYVKEVTHIV